MLCIGQTSLPRTPLTYIAFRVALLDTADRMTIAEESGRIDERPIGYLTEVPYLRRVAPQVQIDLLLAAWANHVDHEKHRGSLVDEAVIYAACESAAKLVENEPHVVSRLLDEGPIPHYPPLTESLAERLRRLHLELDNDGDFLLVSQFEDVPPEEAEPLKTKFGLTVDRTGGMLEAVSRWRMANEWPQRAAGLLHLDERTRLAVRIGSFLAACRPNPLDPLDPTGLDNVGA